MTGLEGARLVRTDALDEHVVRITSYGEVICYQADCPCEGAKASVIFAFVHAGADRAGVTLGELVAAVENHRSVHMPA